MSPEIDANGSQRVARNVVACLNAGLKSTYVSFSRSADDAVVVGRVQSRECPPAAGQPASAKGVTTGEPAQGQDATAKSAAERDSARGQ
jgi:hypothetical protein